MLTTPDPQPNTLGRLIDVLLDDGVISPDQSARAEAVSAESGERLDIVLSRLALATDRQIRDAFASMLGLKAIDAAEFPDTPPLMDELGLRFLSSAMALPIVIKDHRLDLALADPLDQATCSAISLKTGLSVSPRPALRSEIESALQRHAREMELDTSQDEDVLAGDTTADIARLRDMASETPVIRFVNMMIRAAAEARASDIHIEPEGDGLRIRQRVDGVLRIVDAPPAGLRSAVISRIKIMAQLNIAEQRLPQDGRIQSVVAGRDIDLRVATLPTLHGEAIVLRLLDRSGLVLTFEGLGFSEHTRAQIEGLIARPHGMMLVTGPTGSGKTTSLYAALQHLNVPDRKIITVEDPVEYQLAGVTQVQVRSQIGLGFAEVLRATLRNNPNIVMIGEIRDRETAEIAVQAALTGHLVLATLHTNSAAATVNRLRDMGVEDFLISATLIGAMAQRLVRKLCPNCAVAEDEAVVRRLVPDAAGLRTNDFRAPAGSGCRQCNGTGYRGRVGIHEALVVDEAMRTAILDQTPDTGIVQAARHGGMMTMREDGLAKAATGLVRLADVMHVTADSGPR